MPHATRLLLVVFLLISVVDKAKSCSCSTITSNIKSQVRWHNLIFSGKLVSAKITKKTENGHIMSDVTFKFVPSKFWRGTKVDTIVVKQEYSFCGIPLVQAGKSYVIYATANHALHSCGSRLIGEGGIEHESKRLDKLFTRKRFKQLQAAS
ncbi:hypothetical protein [Hymenobacter terrenus]|uniref:hypothetical protein n=1 Tax=Hymenobacter terrenus TaxID=1629124 RepID=UPI0012E021A7|nr:hypothetical protein [Hymenobacter terrenus]